ncbi:hypothetical protein [Salibacter sp.]|jgi:hypothetical protein|uniref:hypothetical protein n=1 Tax=Salibacter sp. TaxID=2010995 RepID=UPI002870A599|nr:hypothetical protein [Salibacter sp.]MDR9488139.1 hypothetical protein [Salibacter sp.]
MSVKERKYKLILELMKVEEESVICEIERLLDQNIVGYKPDGKPISKEEFKIRLEEAEKDIQEGNLFSHQELLEQIKNW